MSSEPPQLVGKEFLILKKLFTKAIRILHIDINNILIHLGSFLLTIWTFTRFISDNVSSGNSLKKASLFDCFTQHLSIQHRV